MEHQIEVSILMVLLWSSGTQSEKVLLVSMDGFRWDYINKADTPNFKTFGDKGTHAQYINNTFITKTFPCHYTIATGLYEESHGIIANKMYDPELNETFNMGTKSSKWWNGGEPLWVTARKAGLHSATYFWPGSEAEIRGYRPTIWKAYDESINFTSRVDTVVNWLSQDNPSIDFAMLYFHEPDHTGHVFGPNSQEVLDKVKEMDTILGYLMDKFDEHKLWDKVNVLVTSDHGMTEIDVQNKYIEMYSLVDKDVILQMPTTGPTTNMRIAEGRMEEVIANLTGVPHLEVYKREDVPEFWHYSKNRRILDVVAVAEEGWSIVKDFKTAYKGNKGTHGYDNRLPSMKPIFYARGPNIKAGYQAMPFNSVDIYPLVCQLLGMSPAPNNGTLSNTQDFIIQNHIDPNNSATRSVTFMVALHTIVWSVFATLF